MRVRIRGKHWDFRFVSRLSTKADCDHPETNGKKIRVRKGLEPQMELDSTIHELLHAGHWDLAEEAVNEMATDIAKVLWDLGYRKNGVR